ncbi:MAG: FkbM family methyltransferase [Bacteroidota bacterium]|nr:FkbM family methyltransferase [Bacteroidota bacterium]
MNLLTSIGLTKNVITTVKFDNDININVNLNDWIQKQIYFFGWYELEKNETFFWKKLLNPDSVIFDIGANVGYYSLISARSIGPKGEIFAFEPVKQTFNKLQKNINLNDFKNITAENIAISDKKGHITLYTADETNIGTSSITDHLNYSGEKLSVPSITLDEYLLDKDILKIDMIKIDVEGSEFNVLKGMAETIKKFQPHILIEILDEKLEAVNSNKEELYSFIENFSYQSFEIISSNTCLKLKTPIEGGLIVFKSSEKTFPPDIRVIE